MKTRINGKRYDTEAASLLYGWSNRKDRKDLEYESFGVYVKTTGEFFIHGCGGAASAWGFDQESGAGTFGEGVFQITKWTAVMIGEALLHKNAIRFYRCKVFLGTRAEQEENGDLAIFIGRASRFVPAAENSGCKVG